MKTKNIFSILLMTLAMVMGAMNVQAEDVWTGTASSAFTVDKEKFATITTNDKILVYVADLNIYYWSLGISIDGNINNTAKLVSNWKGESYGYQTNGNNNLVDDTYLQFELNDDGVEAIKAHGLELKDHNGVTVTKVSVVSGEGPVIVKYTLTYTVDGTAVKTEKLAEGATPTPPDAPAKTGHTFAGWEGLPTAMPAGDLTVTATFTPNKHTITYYINDAVYDTQEVAYGTAIVPITPSLNGYKFNGWGWYPETMPDNDIDIKGTSSKLYNLTLSFDSTKGAVTATKTAGIEQNEQINVTVTPVEGYEVASVTFAGSDGSTPQNWGNYTVQFGTADITCTVEFREAAAVVYNIWNGNVQGGNVTASPTTAEAGQTVTLTLAPNGDYVLASLNVRDQANNSIEVVNNQFTMPAGNVWIDATFVNPIDLLPKHTLTISIDGQTSTREVPEGTALSAVLPTPVKDGYKFTGWSGLTADGKMPTTDLTVTAQFSVITYTLTFKLDNEDFSVQKLKAGDAITAPSVNGKDGYTFSGWLNVPAIMPASDLVIYGHFSKDKVFASLAVGAAGYNTYCSDVPLYFQGSESVKAYIAKAKSATLVTLTQVVGAVAAGTGLVLIGDAAYATADIEVVESGKSYDNNLLVGVADGEVTIQSANQYVLVEKDGTVKFADTSANAATVAAGKAYLQGPSNGSRVLAISIEDSATSVSSLPATASGQPGAFYNLKGQRVNSPKSGLYIVDGKKVIIR